jgi:hypothetical protein
VAAFSFDFVYYEMQFESTTFRMTLKKKKKMGRPPLPRGEARSVFSVRFSDGERAVVESAAKREGEPVTQWARKTLLAAAQ